ncbi:MAG: hypothetical protein EA402_02160 [Planctomycetota bacterium]|nr:MAG: hypothetical protein EA402_02160 [Planctomycetota bacterium]
MPTRRTGNIDDGNGKKRPTTRRNLRPVDDLRPYGSDGSRPPLLELDLKHKLKIMALANALPLIIFIGVFAGWSFGHIEFSMDGNRLLFTFLIMLCALVLIGSCWWVLFPFSVWLRAYPLWYYRHESKLIWALPTCAAWCAWFILWVGCLALTLFSIWLIAVSIMDLISRM